MKLAFKHVLTAIILILSLTAPVAAGPHEDARSATGYNAAALNQSRAVRAGQGASRLLVAHARAGEARGGLLRSSR